MSYPPFGPFISTAKTNKYLPGTNLIQRLYLARHLPTGILLGMSLKLCPYLHFSALKCPPWTGFPDSSVGKESACNAEDPGSIPGSDRSSGEGIGYPLPVLLGFPCGSAGKESTRNVEDLVSIPGLGRSPCRRERLSTPVFWPREFQGLYSPWGRKESDTIEQLSLSLCGMSC